MTEFQIVVVSIAFFVVVVVAYVILSRLDERIRKLELDIEIAKLDIKSHNTALNKIALWAIDSQKLIESHAEWINWLTAEDEDEEENIH